METKCQKHDLMYCQDCNYPSDNTSGWIKVEDRLPETNKVVLGHIPDRKMRTVHYSPLSGWWDGDWQLVNDAITHWMPLPPAPED